MNIEGTLHCRNDLKTITIMVRKQPLTMQPHLSSEGAEASESGGRECVDALLFNQRIG